MCELPVVDRVVLGRCCSWGERCIAILLYCTRETDRHCRSVRMCCTLHYYHTVLTKDAARRVGQLAIPQSCHVSQYTLSSLHGHEKN